MELSKRDKLALIDQQDRQISAAIYSQVINKRVGAKVMDDKLEKSATDELVRLEKIRDAIAVLRAEEEAKPE